MDVVVVGGGIAGLTAAYQIHKKDTSLHIVVLEAKGNYFTHDHKLSATVGLGICTGTGNFVCNHYK